MRVPYRWRIPAQDTTPHTLTRGTVAHANGEIDEMMVLSTVDRVGRPVPWRLTDFVIGATLLVRSRWRPHAVAAFTVVSDRIGIVQPRPGGRDTPPDAAAWGVLVTELAPTVDFFHGERVTVELLPPGG